MSRVSSNQALRCPYCRAVIVYRWVRGQRKVELECPICKFTKVVEACLMKCPNCGHITPHAVGRVRGERRYWVCVHCGNIQRIKEEIDGD